jgi:hypothetical protein
VIVIAGVWLVRRPWTQLVVGATVAFPQTAAIVVDGNGFPLFYLAVVELAVLSVPQVLVAVASRRGSPTAAARARFVSDALAVALVVWAAVITIAGPRIFAGMRVFEPSLGVDSQVGNLSILEPTLGNVAQLGYLTLGVLFVLLSGRLFPVDTRLLGATLWVSLVLGAVRMVAEPVWPRALLQNMPGYAYATPERLSGTFYEPSVLGLYLVAAACYFGVKLLQPGARSRIAALVALVLVAVEFVANGSGTALLGLVIVAAIGVAVLLVRQLLSPNFGVRPWAIITGTAVFAAGLTQLPALYELTIGSAERKASSFSFLARSLANERSWQIFLETSGLGVGLGSHRPSSLFFLVLSCLGLVGTVLLVALVIVALRAAARTPGAAPAGWALLGILVSGVIAVPDLSMPVIWIGLAACLAMAGRVVSASPDAELLLRAPGQVPALQAAEIAK